MIAFERPLVLLALLGLPAFFFLRRLLRDRGAGLALSLGPAGGASFGTTAFPRRMFRSLSGVLFGLGFTALVLSAASPIRLSHHTLYLSRGNEIIIVLDVSPSMAAADFEPSRLEAAKAIIERFLASRRNETVGLVAFGGEAALIAPPTLDYGALHARLKDIVPGMLGDGTAIGAGIATAVAHGSRSEAPEKHLILLTDGEGNAGPLAPVAAAGLAAKNGFSLSVIGVGRRGEVPLSYVDPGSGTRRSGRYLSGFDRAVLESLARAGGGPYYDAEDAESLGRAFAALAERSASLARTRSITTEESLTPWLFLLSLVAVGLGRFFGLVSGSELP